MAIDADFHFCPGLQNRQSKKADLPRSCAELPGPKWEDKLSIQASAHEWFYSVLGDMGGRAGHHVFSRLGGDQWLDHAGRPSPAGQSGRVRRSAAGTHGLPVPPGAVEEEGGADRLVCNRTCYGDFRHYGGDEKSRASPRRAAVLRLFVNGGRQSPHCQVRLCANLSAAPQYTAQ